MYEVQVCADKQYIKTQHFKINKHSTSVNEKTNNTNSKVQQIVASIKSQIFRFI